MKLVVVHHDRGPVSTFVLVVMATLLRSAGAAVAQQTEPPAAAAPAEAPDYIDQQWSMMQDGWHAGFGYGLVLQPAFVAAAHRRAAAGGVGGDLTPDVQDAPRDIWMSDARGEIDRDEYRRRRADLNGTDLPS